VTIAKRPSRKAGRAKQATKRGGGEANYFAPPDWTTQIALMRLDKLPFSRMRVLGPRGQRGRTIATTSA